MTELNMEFITIVILLVLGFAFLFSGMYLGAAMGLFGFLGLLYMRGLNHGLGELMTVPYTLFSTYDFSVIPLFILMGQICFYAGMSADIFGTAYKWLGQLRGGLAMATVAACAGFAAVSGSSVATAVTMGLVAVPEMKKYKYDVALSTGALAAGGTIGILIPPSINFIIYGIMTGQSIGQLFLAGVLPGILQACLFILVVFILCKRNPSLGPVGPRTTLKEKLISMDHHPSLFRHHRQSLQRDLHPHRSCGGRRLCGIRIRSVEEKAELEEYAGQLSGHHQKHEHADAHLCGRHHYESFSGGDSTPDDAGGYGRGARSEPLFHSQPYLVHLSDPRLSHGSGVDAAAHHSHVLPCHLRPEF
jgi:hypothetical protein